MDDFKDFAQQAKLEVKKAARSARVNAEMAIGERTHAASSGEISTKHKLEGAKSMAAAELANARDTGEQVGLELKMKGRDARLAFDKSAAGSKINDAALATAAAAHSAKESVLDAVLPTEKVVEATSTRGVNITHVEVSGRASLLLSRARGPPAAQPHARHPVHALTISLLLLLCVCSTIIESAQRSHRAAACRGCRARSRPARPREGEGASSDARQRQSLHQREN